LKGKQNNKITWTRKKNNKTKSFLEASPVNLFICDDKSFFSLKFDSLSFLPDMKTELLLFFVIIIIDFLLLFFFFFVIVSFCEGLFPSVTQGSVRVFIS
jgi:hypothetical protein